jgi:hypothetical protein
MCHFLLLDFLFFIVRLIQKFCINIIYFVITYFIIRDTLIMIYFIIYIKLSNKKSKIEKRHFLIAREMEGKEIEDEPRRHKGIHQLLVTATIITRVTAY